MCIYRTDLLGNKKTLMGFCFCEDFCPSLKWKNLNFCGDAEKKLSGFFAKVTYKIWKYEETYKSTLTRIWEF